MLRAYRIEVVRMMRDSGEISSFIPALAHCFTDRVVEIPVSHAERLAGTSRYSLFGLFSLLLDLLTGFSMFSLRALSAFGIGMAALGVALGVLIVILRLSLGSDWAAQGVFTLFAVLFVFVGAQFVALGLLGEYLGRVYDQVRQRPRYVVRSEIHPVSEVEPARAAGGRS
jgi:undecaprenyl-phosphate 4-deoxy-4-formamido-L-arabinose transferase